MTDRPHITGYHADSLAPTILKLHAEGFRGGDIAAHLGCSHANVSQTLTRYGIANQRAYRPHIDRKALALPSAARISYTRNPSPDRLATLLLAQGIASTMTTPAPDPDTLPGPICGACARKRGFTLKAVTTPGYGSCSLCAIVTATFPPDAFASPPPPAAVQAAEREEPFGSG